MNLKTVYTAAALVLAGIPAHAQQPDEVSMRDTLSQATVTASRHRDVIPAQTLAGEKLHSLSANSVADALRYFSGIQIKDYGGVGGLKTIDVRSMGSHHVGIFYDGIQISDTQNGIVDLGRFSMDNMEIISVHNGQKSGTFQSAKDFASASSVYMVSRRPKFTSGNNAFTARVRGGSFDLADISLLWDRRINSHISATANAEFLYTSGRYRFSYSKDGGYDTTEIRRNGDVHMFRAETGAFGRYEHTEWDAKAYFYISDRGYPGAAVRGDGGISLMNEDRQKDCIWFLQGSFTHRFPEVYSIMAKGKYSNSFMRYIMPPETTLQPADNRYRQQEIYISVSNLFTITPWWSANLAVDYQWNRLDADGSDMFDAHFIAPRRHSLLAAASTVAELPFGLNVQASLLWTFVKDVAQKPASVMQDKSLFTPSLVMSYTPWKHVGLTFRAFYKNIFRMPTFNDLYYVQVGNRNLRPEYTDQIDIGAGYRKSFGTCRFSGIEVSADLYYNKVRDKIVATPTSNQLVWTMDNIGLVKILGSDISVTPSFRFGPVGMDLRLSYTYQRARDLSPEKKPGPDDEEDGIITTWGHQIPYVPEHSGTAVFGMVFRSWSLHYSFIYTGERYGLGGNTEENYIQPWYTSDISVSKQFALRKCTLGVTAEVNNIFNQQYEVVKWYPMPGTNFKITISITI